MKLVRFVVGLAVPFVGATMLAAACTSSEILSSTDGGGSSGPGTSGLVVREDANEEPLPKQIAAVTVALQPSSVQRDPCPFDGPWAALGSIEPWAPIEDGSGTGTDKALVSCRVIPNLGGTAFEVFGAVDAPGDTPGTPRSTFQGTITAAGEGSPVIFSISKNKDDFSSNQCFFRFSKPAHGIAAGRFWGQVVCEEAETVPSSKLCRSIAEVRFENCRTQQ